MGERTIADTGMTMHEYIDAVQRTHRNRRPRYKKCACGSGGTYRCRLCGTDCCPDHGAALRNPGVEVPRAVWLTCLCPACEVGHE